MALAPGRHCGVTVTKKLGLCPPSHTPQGLGPPYLGWPVAMDQDWEGVIGQVPCSHVAHFKLEHDLIWGSESTAPSSIRPRSQAQGPTSGLKSQLCSGYIISLGKSLLSMPQFQE